MLRKFFHRIFKKKPLALISVLGDKSSIALVKKPKKIGDLISLYINRS